jgi:type IV fimbrial biogenesis protein FimT
MKRESGATLIELLVALTVLGILVSIAAPSFRNIRDVNRVKAAAEAVYAQLQFARSEAIKQHRDLWVQVTPGDGSTSADWCLGISNDSGCDCMTAGSCKFGPEGAEIERTLSSDNFEGISISSTRDDIFFEPRRGMSMSPTTSPTNGTIFLIGADGLTVSARHSRHGRVILCSDEDGEADMKQVRGYPSCP